MPSSSAALVAERSVFEEELAFLHFALGDRADADLSHAAGQFCQPLLEFFPVVIARRGPDLGLDLLDPPVDGGLVAHAANDRRFVGSHGDLLGRAQVGELDRFERDAEVLEDRLAPVSTAMSPSMALRRSP